jgi:hypothetical protein
LRSLPPIGGQTKTQAARGVVLVDQPELMSWQTFCHAAGKSADLHRFRPVQ